MEAIMSYFPYIGITGFTKQSEVSQVLAGETLQWIPTDRKIMIGILSNSKTLVGIQNKFPNRNPAIATIPSIFLAHEKVFNVIHYHSDETTGRMYYAELCHITNMSGKLLQGIQLNNAWPNPGVIMRYRSTFPHIQIILQIGEKAFQAIDYSRRLSAKEVALCVVKKLLSYKNIIDAVLIGRSGGYGKKICIGSADACLHALENILPELSYGIAGGLSPEGDDLEPVRVLAKQYPKLSTDSESGVRDANDHLKIDKARLYLKKVSCLLQAPHYDPAA